jgi:hypothetical protein
MYGSQLSIPVIEWFDRKNPRLKASADALITIPELSLLFGPKIKNRVTLLFGNPAILILKDPWLSVPVSRQVWLYPVFLNLQNLFPILGLMELIVFYSDISMLCLRRFSQGVGYPYEQFIL